jgi:hypothetical protein
MFGNFNIRTLQRPSLKTKKLMLGEISCSHSGKYEDESLLGYSAIQSLVHHPDDGGSMHL